MMSTIRFKRLREEDAVWEISNGMLLDREQMELYNEDPDLYVAQTQGFDTAKEFFEWCDSGGTVMCGGLTKAGRPCQAVVKHDAKPGEWRRLHRREGRCYNHAGQPKSVISLETARRQRAQD
jgi:hypothetical protein